MTNNIAIPPTNTPIIALINCNEATCNLLLQCKFGDTQQVRFKNGVDLLENWERSSLNIVAIISQTEVMATSGVSLLEALTRKNIKVPFFILCQQLNDKISRIALQAGVSEVFQYPYKVENLETRVNFNIDNWNHLRNKDVDARIVMRSYKTPLGKRIFDIFFAGSALLLLSPLFILVTILIQLESKGPVFYYALRVGRGYHIFKFFKFRSMNYGADKNLKDLKHLNQYDNGKLTTRADDQDESIEYLCTECRAAGTKCRFPIYSDTLHMCEKEYMDLNKVNGEATFIKIKNDPRMTRVGRFIRRTSIDELPQLWNVVIGDMSIVGNRPLPLYEAEKLTTDRYAMRFIAPAGITGLWQVEKRGKGKMSERERLILDNIYAKNNSFFNDIVLILRTIPALFQKHES